MGRERESWHKPTSLGMGGHEGGYMSITRIDFDRLSETDLRSLQENGVAEGIQLDYKRELYGNSDADKREFLKDVSSFANTAGGHIIIGVTEEDGVPES